VQRVEHVTDAAGAEASARVVEFSQTQAVLRAFGRSREGFALLDDALVGQRDAGRRLLTSAVPGLIGFTLIVQTAFVVILLLGTYLALGGEVAVPELIALLVLAVRYVEPMLMAGEIGSALRIAQNDLNRVDDVLATAPLPEPDDPATVADADVEFDGVTFGYEADTPVLRDVSFRVPARTMTAIVGPSGSGKTTVTRLIARFFDVDAGVVRVGGEDVRDLTTEQLMGELSLVFQDVYLFEGTIADNIRVGDPDADDDAVREAARLARVDEVVDRLPQGWDTQVGEGGTRLSGGERQRVSIARAILKDTPIVLLDEATAALDPENEAAVQDALTALTADRTLLVIAHRLQTVTAADQIVVLDEGRVAELGTHDELLARGGRYATFWRERSRAAGWRLAGADEAAR
jgi:ATP-binding cassette subfamily B protein